MNTHIDKKQKKKSQSVADATQRKSSNMSGMKFSGDSNHQQLTQKKENKTGLPDQLKVGVESLSSLSLDDVHVHRNSDKPAQLQAHAYTKGSDIHLASGQEKHLPHEAWHVVQQKQGRVTPTVQVKAGVRMNDDAELEKEADAMGKKAIQMNVSDVIQSKSFLENEEDVIVQQKYDSSSIGGTNGTIQCASIEEDKQALKDVLDASEDELLNKILREVIDTLDKDTTTAKHGKSSQQSHMGPKGKFGEDRSHEIVIDPDHYPDDVERQSVLVHETIHASSDTKYGFNKDFDQSAFNIVHKSDDETGDVETYQSQVPVLIELLNNLKSKVEKERATLGNKLADHILVRINRAIGAPNQEFDTVISELYYYLKIKHSDITEGETYEGIKKTADAAYEARNSGTTLRETFEEDLPSLNTQKKRRDYKESIEAFRYTKNDGALRTTFESTQEEGLKALDEATDDQLAGEYKKHLLNLMKVILVSYGNRAKTIAEGKSLSQRELTFEDGEADIGEIEGWRDEAQEKLDKKWFFKDALREAIRQLGVIISDLKLFKNRYKGLDEYTPKEL